MQEGLYVALSSHIALEQRLATLADNVANSNTVGFRATEIRFSEVLDGISKNSTAFVSDGTSYLSNESGALVQTQNAFDFAVNGDAWFGIDTPAGMVLTRDGRFQMTPEGELITLTGHKVVDPGGAPIQLNPKGSAPVVGRDGFIMQDGNQVGALGIFAYTPGANYQRFGVSGIVPKGQPEPAVNRNDISVVQGFVEQANVNPVKEITELISIQRTFEDVAAMMRDSESSMEAAIGLLGGKS